MTNQSTITPSISFDPWVNVYDVLHVDDYSDQEVAACWYTPKEKELIRLEIRNTRMIMKIRGGLDIDGDIICTRGLEEQEEEPHRTTTTTIATEEQDDPVDDVRNAVLEEQESQFAMGIFDADKIAAVCSEKTLRQQSLARIMGCADQHWMLSNMTPQELMHIKIIVPCSGDTQHHHRDSIHMANTATPCQHKRLSFNSRAA